MVLYTVLSLLYYALLTRKHYKIQRILLSYHIIPYQTIPTHTIYSVQNAEPTRLQQVDTRPHYIVRRFAEYSSSIMQLDDKRNTPQVIQALANMRDEGA